MHRQKAWERFEALGLPTKKQPSYNFVPLSQLYNEPFEITSVPHALEKQENTLVFLNGRFESSLSSPPKEIHLEAFASFLSNRFSKLLKEEKDPFAALNFALSTDSAFLYIPPQTKIEKPVRILHFFNEPLVFPRLHLFVGTGSTLSLVFESFGGDRFLNNQIHDLTLEENAQVTYTNTTKAHSGFGFHALRAHLKKGSKLTTFSLNEGGKCQREDYKITLAGVGSSAYLYGLTELHDSLQAHTHVFMEHSAPHCTSSQLFKTVLHDASKSSFEGKIYVHAEAQKTDAFQLSRHLLLSPHAVAHTKPNLEILADDVKASHGATVGHLDKEALFYLKSRGIQEEEAKKMLIQAFSKEILDLCKS